MIARAVPFAIGLALTVAYVPGWGGAATTPRWDIGAAMALALLLGPAGRMTHAHWLGLALAGWLILSLAWSSSPLDGAGQAVMLLVIAVAFAWGATLGDIRPFVAGAAIGLAISSVIAVAQWLGWHGIETATITPAGLFYSHNRFGEVAAVVFAAAVGLRMWWALPGLGAALGVRMDTRGRIAAGVGRMAGRARRADPRKRRHAVETRRAGRARYDLAVRGDASRLVRQRSRCLHQRRAGAGVAGLGRLSPRQRHPRGASAQ